MEARSDALEVAAREGRGWAQRLAKEKAVLERQVQRLMGDMVTKKVHPDPPAHSSPPFTPCTSSTSAPTPSLPPTPAMLPTPFCAPDPPAPPLLQLNTVFLPICNDSMPAAVAATSTSSMDDTHSSDGPP